MVTSVITPGYANSVSVLFSFWTCKASLVLFCREELALGMLKHGPSQTDVYEAKPQSTHIVGAYPSPLPPPAFFRILAIVRIPGDWPHKCIKVRKFQNAGSSDQEGEGLEARCSG